MLGRAISSVVGRPIPSRDAKPDNDLSLRANALEAEG